MITMKPLTKSDNSSIPTISQPKNSTQTSKGMRRKSSVFTKLPNRKRDVILKLMIGKTQVNHIRAHFLDAHPDRPKPKLI